MQTDSHIEVLSPDHYYAYSRHIGRTFCNYESPSQSRTNTMLATAVRPVTHEDKHNASNSSKAGDTRSSLLCGSTDYSPVGLQGGSKK